MNRSLLCALALLAASESAVAQLPIQRAFNPDNGHYYEFVRYLSFTEDHTFAAARAATAARSYLGIAGHLVTITSQAEQDFLGTTRWRDLRFWMGASDAEVEGEWRWIDGPEAGQMFWKTDPIPALPNVYPIQGTAIGFESWGRQARGDSYQYIEPNGHLGLGGRPGFDEDYGTVTPRYTGGLQPWARNAWWNDLPGASVSGTDIRNFVDGYVVEYSIPEPTSAAAMIVGGLVLAATRRYG